MSWKMKYAIHEDSPLPPDCLVYTSHTRNHGDNNFFLEKGFKELNLRRGASFAKTDQHVIISLTELPGANNTWDQAER